MSNITEEILGSVLEKLRHIASTEAVVGEPVNVGNLVVVPVIKISLGFAAAGMEGTQGKEEKKTTASGTGGGGGGGVNVTPVGFIVYDGSDVKFLSASGKGGLDNLIAAVPNVVEKILAINAKNQEGSEPR